MAIKIPFAAEVTAFLAGTKKIETAMDDVVDSLDDITVAGAEVDAKVGGDLESVGLAADAAAEKVERSFKDAFKSVEAQGRTSTGKTKAHIDDVGTKGSATLREFNAEAKQNVAETVSSFDGSASSAVDAVQGTFGGLVAALGPAGLVGAAVVGIGIGFAKSLFSKSQEAAEAFRARTLEIFEELRDSGGDIGPDFQADALADIIGDAEKLKEVFGSDSFSDFQQTLQDTALNTRDLQAFMRGLTGDTEDVAAAQTILADELADVGRQLATPGASLTRQKELREQVTALNILRDALTEQGTAAGEARSKYSLYSDLVTESTDKTKDQADAADQAATAVGKSADAIAAENEKLRENSELKGEAVATELDMLDALAAVSDAGKENGKTLDKNTKAGRDNLRAIKSGIDGINDFADAQLAAGKKTDGVNAKLDEQEDALVRKVARAFGVTEGKARDYIKTLGGIPRKKETEVKVTDNGTAAATQEKVDNIKSSGVPVPVSPDMSGFDTSVKRYLNGKAYYVTVKARPGKSVPT
jgi:hypothetical protein